jgi:hypothetical protein
MNYTKSRQFLNDKVLTEVVWAQEINRIIVKFARHQIHFILILEILIH